ncbi:MAG: excalibur calcium-binding domain-containing protein [Segniliparus sp.]|uniref:excalibur calcium-binding domain-containing protein n=1 Tax=Segniliparus sp. TaxID=2804064 RepID=UPI003F2A7926
MGSRLTDRTKATVAAAIAGLALFAPAAAARAEDGQTSGPTQWGLDVYGKPYPVTGWKSCAEAQAHASTPLFRADPGYNPALDPTGRGIECV